MGNDGIIFITIISGIGKGYHNQIHIATRILLL